MTPGLDKTFVTTYLASLKERTRNEQSGVKWGIDWVVYNLGQALYGKPVRLPFLRQADPTQLKSKTEAEFGIDLSFISSEGETLTIFALKDEPLTNTTWVKQGILEDLSKACTPDLSAAGMEKVTEVKVILAYNRDENANGVKLFDNFVKAANPQIAGRANLKILRWNLSELVDLTLRHLLTPALVPQQFFGQLNYLCYQAANFTHGSDEWEKQLVPGWKRFVDDVLDLDRGSRGASLVPVALIIVRHHAATSDTIETGWFDLVEWAAIALWRRYLDSSDHDFRGQVVAFWYSFYLGELQRFYRAHITALGTENSIDQLARGSMVGTVATAMIAHWHMARIGLLSLDVSQLMKDSTPEEKRARRDSLNEVANWMVQLINANDSCLRPILDSHHIELVLLVFTLSNAGRLQEFEMLLPGLVQRLFLRRIEHGEIPFLDGYNSLENFFEQVASGGTEKLITTQSSYYVVVLLELACLLGDKFIAEHLAIFHRRLVLGALDSGPQCELTALHLMSWQPPVDWARQVLAGYVDDGVVVSRGPFADSIDATSSEIHAEMTRFVAEMRGSSTFPESFPLPLGALILASLRYRSPLPPELWRISAFPKNLPPAVAERA
jgi:hypothetical protein